MKITGWFVLGAIALTGCGEKPAPTPNPAAPAPSGNPLTAPVDYLGANVKAKNRAVKVAGELSLSQAIALFRSEQDRFPKDLNELVTSGHLRALPKAPYQMKFAYNPQTGEVSTVPE